MTRKEARLLLAMQQRGHGWAQHVVRVGFGYFESGHSIETVKAAIESGLVEATPFRDAASGKDYRLTERGRQQALAIADSPLGVELMSAL